MEVIHEADSALGRLVAALADNKCSLGRRYAEWCTGAPALESAVAAASMAQDEIGHARSLYPLLAELSSESDQSEPETRTRFTNVAFLNQPFEEWTDFVAANFVFDTAVTILLEGACDSTLTSLAQRARRMVEEERLHWLHGEGWLRRLARERGELRRHLQASIDRAVPGSLSIFAVAEDALVEEKILTQGEQTMNARFRERIGPVLRAADLNPL